jgi:hypothetical protein
MSGWRRVRGFLPALAAVLAAAAAGCNFFRPEDPPIPVDPPPIADYSTPDATLETIRVAIEDKRSVSAAAYIGAFADPTLVTLPGYQQIFHPEDEIAHRAGGGNVPAVWDVTLERRFFDISPRNLLGLNAGRYQVTFLPHPTLADRESATEAILHRWYQILAVDPISGQVTEIIAQGYAELTLLPSPTNWLITRWEDQADPEPNEFGFTNQPTWGRRRLESQ